MNWNNNILYIYFIAFIKDQILPVRSGKYQFLPLA